MKFIGNILWLLLGGLATSLMYLFAGLICCVTVIGFPFGYQLIKIGLYALWPFGRTLQQGQRSSGPLHIIFNILWVLLGWWEIALIHLVCGLLFCITIVGIPFGRKHFAIAIGSLIPFGMSIVQE